MDQNNTAKDLAENLAKEAGIQQSTLTPKQLEKKRKQEEAYWNKMISRREAFDLMQGMVASQNDKLRRLYIVTNTLLSVIKETGLATQDQLDEYAKPFIELMYGPDTEEKKEKDEVQGEA